MSSRTLVSLLAFSVLLLFVSLSAGSSSSSLLSSSSSDTFLGNADILPAHKRRSSESSFSTRRHVESSLVDDDDSDDQDYHRTHFPPATAGEAPPGREGEKQFAFFSEANVNKHGDVAFAGYFHTDITEIDPDDFDGGVYEYRAKEGTLIKILAHGNKLKGFRHLSGDTAFMRVGVDDDGEILVSYNNDGTIAFISAFQDSNGATCALVQVRRDHEPRILVECGDIAPSSGGTVYRKLSNLAENDHGDVAFAAQLFDSDDNADDEGGTSDGLWLYRNDNKKIETVSITNGIHENFALNDRRDVIYNQVTPFGRVNLVVSYGETREQVTLVTLEDPIADVPDLPPTAPATFISDELSANNEHVVIVVRVGKPVTIAAALLRINIDTLEKEVLVKVMDQGLPIPMSGPKYIEDTWFRVVLDLEAASVNRHGEIVFSTRVAAACGDILRLGADGKFTPVQLVDDPKIYPRGRGVADQNFVCPSRPQISDSGAVVFLEDADFLTTLNAVWVAQKD